ncbi:DUF916 and DUF3324 domain-containing protein [Enterococcus faecium]|nr:DUF916 and DUF3324 domain-containing protein [Enterococcus faecium]
MNTMIKIVNKCDRKSSFVIQSLLFILMILAFLTPLTTHAETSGDFTSFTVEGIPNEHQIDGNLGYFFLKEDPGNKDKIGVKVINEGNTTQKVSIKITDANTNTNGIIDYSGKVKNSKYLTMPLSKYVKAPDSEVEVPAHSTKDVWLDLTMPDNKFKGVIIGSVNILDSQDNKEQEGLTLANRYGYTLGIVLANEKTDLNKSVSVELDDVQAKLFDGHKVVQADIVNKNPYIFKADEVNAQVSKYQSDKVINKVEKRDVSIAPYQIYPLQLDWGKRNLSPGKYVLKCEVKYKDDTWKFEKIFEIKENKAKEINQKSVIKVQIPSWLIYLIIALIIINVGITIYITVRRRKQDEK